MSIDAMEAAHAFHDSLIEPAPVAPAAEGLTAAQLRDLAMRFAHPTAPDPTPLERFAAGHPARIVHVLGNGPSARDFKRPEGHVVIAVNGALAQCPDADYALAGETSTRASACSKRAIPKRTPKANC
jgi:hypothetical protein